VASREVTESSALSERLSPCESGNPRLGTT
jgi:hypothetical protein